MRDNDVGSLMNRVRSCLVVSVVLLALVGCGVGERFEEGAGDAGGEGSSSLGLDPVYALKSVDEIRNQTSLSLGAHVLSKVSFPDIASSQCVNQSLSFSIWSGDFPDLDLSGTDSVQLVTAMSERRQIWFSHFQNEGIYQTFLDTNRPSFSAFNIPVDVPKGTTEVWYEFYCSVGTLSAGKVGV